MELTELYTTTVQESTFHTHQSSCSIPGANNQISIAHNTEIAINDTLAAFKGINISDDSSTVTGVNDEHRQNNEIGTNIGTVKGMNTTESIVPETPTTDNMQINIIQGINNEDNSSSESSEFDGFTSGDLKCDNTSEVDLTEDSSTILTSNNYIYDDTVEDSSDTIPATENISQDPHLLPSIENNADPILPEIRNIWEKDAMTKTWDSAIKKAHINGYLCIVKTSTQLGHHEPILKS